MRLPENTGHQHNPRNRPPATCAFIAGTTKFASTAAQGLGARELPLANELLFLTEGNGTAHVNGRALPISAGDILFFNSGESPLISASRRSPDLLRRGLRSGSHQQLLPETTDIQQKYIHRQTSGELLFQTVFHPKSPGTEPLRQSLEAIRSFTRRIFSPMSSSSRRNFSGSGTISAFIRDTSLLGFYPKDDSKILLTKKILRFIQEHYSSILTLEGLSAFHMSEGQFCRFFKSQVHMLPRIHQLLPHRRGLRPASLRLRARKLHRHRLRLQQYQLFQPHVPKIHALHPERVPENSQRDSVVKTDPEGRALPIRWSCSAVEKADTPWKDQCQTRCC